MMTTSGPRRNAGRRNGNVMRQPLVLLLAGSAALAAAGCTEDPSLYVGGPPGAAVKQRLSNSNLVVVVGDSVKLGARAEDEVGNTVGTAPTVTSCDGAVIGVGSAVADPVYTTGAWIRGLGLGVSCLEVSADGLVDTVQVVTGPPGVGVTGPDTVLSGTTGAYSAVPVNLAGDTLAGTTRYEWTPSSTALASVDRNSGTASGKAPGTVGIRIRAPGGAMGVKNVVIVPGVFGGSFPVTSGAPGTLVSVNQDPRFKWDGDTQFRLGNLLGFVDRVGPGGAELFVAVPATGATTAQTALFTSIDYLQAALSAPAAFTPTLALDDVYGPANLGPPGPVVEAVRSPGRHIYLVNAGTCTGGSGANCDDFFTISAGASPRTVTATLTWNNNTNSTGDLDILWCDAPCAAFTGNFDGAGSAKPEVSTVTIPANTTWRLWINNFSQTAANFTNARLTLSN